MKDRECYSNPVVSQVPRLLTHINRNRFSSTYGCCTRDFWHYRILDIPNSQTQAMALTLALLYRNRYPGNAYHGKEFIRDLSVAAVRFWTRIQNRNGSFDEVYKNQDSFAATAFTSYAISETLGILGDFPGRASALRALKRACIWLSSTEEKIAMNQVMVSIAAMHNVYCLTGDERFKRGVESKLSQLRKAQTSEGWFNEYGGADIGYTSLGLSYLSKYWSKSRDPEALEIIRGMAGFLSFFVYPGGSMAGICGSRNTEYIFPHALELLSEKVSEALEMRNSFLGSLRECRNTFLEKSLDDRYFIYMGYEYLQAYDSFSSRPAKPGQEKNVCKHFPEAGLFVFSNGNYRLVANLRKGGIFSSFSPGLSYSDSGYFARDKKGKLITTQHIDRKSEIEVDGKSLKIRSSFFRVPDMQSSPLIHIGMKSFNLIAPGFMRRIFLDMLRNKAVSAKRDGSVIERSFVLGDSEILVRDRIVPDREFSEIGLSLDRERAMHFASSGFFQESEADLHRHDLGGVIANTIGEDITLTRRVDFRKKKVEVTGNGILGSD